jgi:hypothetical protein
LLHASRIHGIEIKRDYAPIGPRLLQKIHILEGQMPRMVEARVKIVGSAQCIANRVPSVITEFADFKEMASVAPQQSGQSGIIASSVRHILLSRKPRMQNFH